MKPQEEEEEREDNSFSENGMQCAEGATDPRTHIHLPYIDNLSVTRCILAIELVREFLKTGPLVTEEGSGVFLYMKVPLSCLCHRCSS